MEGSDEWKYATWRLDWKQVFDGAIFMKVRLSAATLLGLASRTMSTTGMTFYPSAPSSLAGAQALDTSWFLKAPEKGVSDFMSKRAKGAKFLDVTHLGHPDGGIHAIPSATTYEAFLKSNDISPTTPLLLYQGKDAMAMVSGDERQ